MNFPRLTIWQQWLLHAFLLWAGMELSDIFTYWYKTREGAYIFNVDNSPVTQWQRFVNHNYYQGVWAVILAGTLPIELNYHLIFKKRPFSHFLVSSILCAIAFIALLSWFNQWKFGGYVNSFIPPIIVIAAYSFGYALLRDFIQQRINQTQQHIQQSQAELNALKAQINPHFFFNTLNTIYGTALIENAEQTAASIEQLAGIMRYTIGEAQQDFTSIANEVNFIADYLHLQRLRLPQLETIQIQSNLDYDGGYSKIAPLLLIPFVENAFKYGVRVDQACFIKLQLTIRDQQLDLSIENSVFPIRSDLVGLGTGIRNTEKRLQYLYPNRHRLSYREDAWRYSVLLFIDLH